MQTDKVFSILDFTSGMSFIRYLSEDSVTGSEDPVPGSDNPVPGSVDPVPGSVNDVNSFVETRGCYHDDQEYEDVLEISEPFPENSGCACEGIFLSLNVLF